MFVQIFEGNTDDPQAVRDRVERWEREVRPGAIGYLGSTGGVTDDGRVVMLARFTDRAAAEANSARPEQSAWWAEVEQCFTGPVTFHETDDITEMRHGDAQQARFVQVMEGHVTDRVRAERLQDKMEPLLSSMRPDLLGTTTTAPTPRSPTSPTSRRPAATSRPPSPTPWPASWPSGTACCRWRSTSTSPGRCSSGPDP